MAATTSTTTAQKATGMSAAWMAGASCLDYVRALVAGAGCEARVSLEGFSLGVAPGRAEDLPRLYTALSRWLPVTEWDDGTLSVASFVWVASRRGHYQVRVLSYTATTARVVVLDAGVVRRVARKRLHSGYPGWH